MSTNVSNWELTVESAL